jgi:hypothetical protein
LGLGGSLAAIEFAFADFLGKGFVVEAPGHELAFGVEVGDLAAEEAAGPEEGDVRLAPGESAVPVALMQVAHGSDVPLAARRQHRAAGAAVGAGGALGAAGGGAAGGALGAAVAPPPGPAPRAGGLRAVHLALGDTGRSVTVIALAAVTARFAPASTALATAALVAAAFACTALIAIAVVAALGAAVARTLALPAAFEARVAAFEARAVRTADLAATSKGERVGSGHAGRRRRYFFLTVLIRIWIVTHHGRQQEMAHTLADPMHLTGHVRHPARQLCGSFLYQTLTSGMMPRHDAT